MMSNIAQAFIFFGSTQENKAQQQTRLSSYNGELVSSAPVCDTKDTMRALSIGVR